MSDKVFVDTNIIVYAHDRSAGAKFVRANALLKGLWETNRGVLSTQVLQEFCVNARRRFSPPFSTTETQRAIEDFLSWEIVVNTPESVLRALEIESRYTISFWDALILQAAESAGADVLYSEDFSHGQKYGSVRVVNPLITD